MRVLILSMAFLQTAAAAGIEDFAWLAGKWTAEIPAGKVEQSCSPPSAGLIQCMFRLDSPEKTLVLEFMSFRNTPSGVELRLRHFSPEMNPWEKDDAITLRLRSRSGDTFIFENPVHSRPKRTTMRRDGPDRVTNRSEIVSDDGSTRVIEVTLRRAAATTETAWQGVKNSSYVTPSGERVLEHQVIVNAPLRDVWNAFTTSEGLKSFVAPVVEVELKTGGKFHSNYTAGSKIGDPGTIYNQVLAYVPMKMFSIKIGLTDQFPAALRQAGTLFAVIHFDDLGDNRVKVTESMLGWKEGPEWDQTYQFFDKGNAYTLRRLVQRFEKRL